MIGKIKTAALLLLAMLCASCLLTGLWAGESFAYSVTIQGAPTLLDYPYTGSDVAGVINSSASSYATYSNSYSNPFGTAQGSVTAAIGSLSATAGAIDPAPKTSESSWVEWWSNATFRDSLSFAASSGSTVNVQLTVGSSAAGSTNGPSTYPDWIGGSNYASWTVVGADGSYGQSGSISLSGTPGTATPEIYPYQQKSVIIPMVAGTTLAIFDSLSIWAQASYGMASSTEGSSWLAVEVLTPGVNYTAASGVVYPSQLQGSPVPIPASFLLLCPGLVGLAGIRRRFGK